MLDLDTADEAEFHQMMLERQQMGEEAAKRLAQHTGTWRDIDYLCHMAGIRSPFDELKCTERK